MQSGQVTLSRGASSGRHSTEEYEELLVVLEGKGEIILTGERPLVTAECAAYLPPRTSHDVYNSGPAVLRYVYVAARAARSFVPVWYPAKRRKQFREAKVLEFFVL